MRDYKLGRVGCVEVTGVLDLRTWGVAVWLDSLGFAVLIGPFVLEFSW